MLSAADARIVEADSGLPELRTLLDTDALAASIARLPQYDGIDGVEIDYVRYKRGTSCLVGCRLTSGSETRTAYARTHSIDTLDKLSKADDLGAQRLDDYSLLYVFPLDHEVPALRHWHDPQQRSELLEKLGALNPRPDEARVLRYKPERRAVLHVPEESGPGLALRFVTREDYERLVRSPSRFVSTETLRVAAMRGRSKTHRAASFDWIEGTALSDGEHAAQPAVLEAVGRALADLHAQRPKSLTRSCTAPDYVAEAASVVEELAYLDRAGADAARDVLDRAARRLLERNWRSKRGLHGDLDGGQIVVAPDGRVGLIDFDRAAFGDPRIDLGSLQAWMILRDGDVDRAVAAMSHVRAGYIEAAGKDVTRRVGAFTAVELIRRALEPFRHRQAEWPQATRRLVDAASLLCDLRP